MTDEKLSYKDMGDTSDHHDAFVRLCPKDESGLCNTGGNRDSHRTGDSADCYRDRRGRKREHRGTGNIRAMGTYGGRRNGTQLSDRREGSGSGGQPASGCCHDEQ